MYSRFSKVFYFLCVVLFIFGFLYIYASLAEKITYRLNDPPLQVSRHAFFFFSMATFFVVNLLFVIPAKMIENQSIPRFRILLYQGDPFKDHLLSWIYSFSGIMNVSLLIMAYYILRINHLDGIGDGGNIFLFYLIPLLLIVWIIALFVILGKKIKQVQSI